MADVHVRLSGVTKRFGANAPAVDSISLDVPRGSFTTLLGPSGCGKTTTLRLIAGFYEPDAGDIFLGDRRINNLPPHRRKTAMVFQDYALFPHLSVFDNVGYGVKLAGGSKAEIKSRVAETLSFLSLNGLESRFPGELSGGQQQRVALARALVLNPEVLLLDEPLSNLDAKLRVTVRGEISSLQRRLGITTIYVTHDQDEALAMSDWVAVMDAGKVAQWGTPWEVYYRPQTPFVAAFVGTVNLMETTCIQVSPDRVRLVLGGQQLEHETTTASAPRDRRALICIRPESLRLAPSEAPPTHGQVALPGTITGQTFLGHVMRYTVHVDGHDWLVDEPDPGRSQVLEGDVRLLVDPERIHVIPEPALGVTPDADTALT